MNKLFMKLISLISSLGLLINVCHINSYAFVELMPNIKNASVVFEPHTAIYEYTGKTIDPIFSVIINGIVDESEYEWEVISIDDEENKTSAGILPGKVTIEIRGTGDESHGYYGATTATYQIIKTSELKEDIKGDCNSDGIFDISDVVLFQKWLLAVPDIDFPNWQAADLSNDDRLNVIDLCLMKRQLLNNTSYSFGDINMNNIPENMPEIISNNNEISMETRESMWKYLGDKYPNEDLSDFTFVYDPNHPLNYYINGKCFYVYYKDLLVHGYGDINLYDNVYAAIDFEGVSSVNLLSDLSTYHELNTEKWDISVNDLTNNFEYAEKKLERIIYVDTYKEKPSLKLAYKAIDSTGDGENIISAETGEIIIYIPYTVT